MANFRDPAYWQRKLTINPKPLVPGDQKLMMGTVFNMLVDLQTKVETLNEEIQSLRSKGTARPRKVVEDSDRPASDS